MNHNWSGWPGAWCLNCGIVDGVEQSLADDCEECHLPYGPEDEDQEIKICSKHTTGKCPGPKDGHNPYKGMGKSDPDPPDPPDVGWDGY